MPKSQQPGEDANLERGAMTPLTEPIDLGSAERVRLAEAKTNLSGMIATVEQTGEPCVIMRYGRPVVVLAPLLAPKPERVGKTRGIFGALRRCGQTRA